MTKRKNPDTSIDAKNSLDPEDIAAIYRKIMISLAALGRGTFEDIAAHCKEPRERIWKRLSELHKDGVIYRTEFKKVLKSGRKGYCWALSNEHTPKTIHEEKVLKGKSISDYSKSINNIAQGKFF